MATKRDGALEIHKDRDKPKAHIENIDSHLSYDLVLLNLGCFTIQFLELYHPLFLIPVTVYRRENGRSKRKIRQKTGEPEQAEYRRDTI